MKRNVRVAKKFPARDDASTTEKKSMRGRGVKDLWRSAKRNLSAVLWARFNRNTTVLAPSSFANTSEIEPGASIAPYSHLCLSPASGLHIQKAIEKTGVQTATAWVPEPDHREPVTRTRSLQSQWLANGTHKFWGARPKNQESPAFPGKTRSAIEVCRSHAPPQWFPSR